MQVEVDDYLRFYDGTSTAANLLAELTGDQTPTNVSTCGNEMHVVFSSNSYGTSTGYLAKIHSVEHPHPGELGHCTSNCPCGTDEGHCESSNQCIFGHYCVPESCSSNLGYANGTNCCQDVSCGFADIRSGLLFSPYFPNDYGNSMLCAHQISAEPGKIIGIEFDSFNVSS